MGVSGFGSKRVKDKKGEQKNDSGCNQEIKFVKF